MKNKFKVLFMFLAMGAMFTSCEDELNQSPFDAFSPDTFYQNIGDFNNASRGLYSGLFRGGYYGGNYLIRPDVMTDNVILVRTGRTSNQFFFDWRYVPNSAWDALVDPYITVNRANRILESINNLSDGADKNNFEGEARAVRAMAHFDMLRVFSKMPTQTGDANGSLGIPYIVTTDPNVRELRPTVAETMTAIIDDLEMAKTLIATDNGVARFGLNAVNALLSRVYLYNGEYQKSIDAAGAVTTGVASRTNYQGIWTDSNSDGIILKLDQDQNLDGIGIGIGWSQSAGGAVIPEYAFSLEFFNQFDDTDIRKAAFWFLGTNADGIQYNVIKKMFGEAGQNNGVVDAKILRAAEMSLNRAESHARLGQDGPALTALDEVRSNRYAGFTSGGETGTALLDAIMLERRLELAFEGHRFFDLKRWGLPVNRSATDGDIADGSGTPADFLTLSATDHRFQLPIPQREINVFPEFQQNPGY